MKYRKKPVVIEAIKYDKDDLSEMLNAWGSDFGKAVKSQTQGSHMIIRTLEGEHIAKMGDYIIKGVKGEFYPCKPDIFEMTYEKNVIN